ncbi:MAG: YjbQ family protein [Chloroflexi bacterium]|nr:MAG: YjbQ family protein [Chloroflexota bacterium]MBL1192789.1 YjbQ family protein [Chloroflexota bacterium]NOH10083.1 YjbQ family protein [Chloroflexota bacterium]
MQKVTLRTSQRQEMVNLLEDVQSVVSESGVEEGMCFVYCPHTTGGLVVNSYMDPNTPKDITFEMDRLVPTRVDFFHINDTPSDAAAHVKASLVGISQTFIVSEGKLQLGHSQGILFAEFDGPRDRHVMVKVVAG